MSDKIYITTKTEAEKFAEEKSNNLEKVTWDKTINLYVENLLLTDMILNKVRKSSILKNIDKVYEHLDKEIKEYVEKVKNPEYQIVIAGAIKAGKSTLINALLGCELASVKVTPETSILTKFRYADKNFLKVSFYTEEEWNEIWQNAVDKKAEVFMDEYKILDAESVKAQYLNKEEIYSTFESLDEMKEEIVKCSSSKKKEHLFVKELEIGLNSFGLPPQICLVDTPGLNDVIDCRAKMAWEYIDSANSVIVCAHAKTLRNEELITIERVFSKARYKKDKIYILGTQIDTMNSEEDWEVQKQKWIKYLKGKEFFESISTAKEHLIGISSYAYMKAKKLKKNSSQVEILKSVKELLLPDEFYTIFDSVLDNKEVDIEELKMKLIERSRIEDVKTIISEKLLGDYNSSMFIDSVEKYKKLKEEIKYFVRNMIKILNEKKEHPNRSEEELNTLIECETQKMKNFSEIICIMENRLEGVKSRFILDFTELTKNLKNLEKGIREIKVDDYSGRSYIPPDDNDYYRKIINCISNYRREAAKYDEMTVMILEDKFNEIEGIFEDINNLGSGKIIDDYIFESIRENFEYIKKDINNIYSKQIEAAFSLNDSKFLDILKIKNRSERKEKIRRFTFDTIIDCNSKLLEEISEVINEQQRFIAEYVEGVREKFRIIQAQTKGIINARYGDKASLEVLKNKYDQLLSQFELLENILKHR